MAARMYRVTFLLCMLLAMGQTDAQEVGENVVISGGTINEDLYVAGERVHVTSAVNGDVIAAGGRIILSGPIEGDVLAVGGVVDVQGNVADDVRAAGGTVTIDSRVGDQVAAAGGTVRILPGALVAGKVWLAGGEVEILGVLGKEARVAGGTVVIAGRVQGDLNIAAREVKILSGARIEGNLIYRSPQQAEISPDAQITGSITYKAVEMPERPSRLQAAGVFAAVFLSLLVSGIVLFLLFPAFTYAAARNIRTAPWKSLGLGFVLLIVTPFAAVVLMMTVLGIPLAFIMLAAYFIALPLSFIITMLFLGDASMRLVRRTAFLSRAWGVAALVIGFIILTLLQLIPVVGGLAGFLALIFGFGALGLQTGRIQPVIAAD